MGALRYNRTDSSTIIGFWKEAEEITLPMGSDIFRAMVEDSSVGFYILDLQGRFVYLNEALADLFGYRASELRGKKVLQLLIHPEDRTRLAQEAKRLLRREVSFSLLYFRGLKRDESEIYCESLLWTVTEGENTFFVGNLLDVTERTVSQRKLSLIRELGRKAILLRDVRAVARALVKAVEEVMGVRSCGLWLVDGETLVRIAHIMDERGLRLPLHGEKGIIAAAVREKRSIYVPDTEREPRYLRGKFRSRSEFCVPLIVRDEVLGALNVEKEEVDGFSLADRELIEALATVAAIAIENAIQFERERKVLKQLKLINEVALKTAALKAPEALYREVVETIAQRFGYHSVSLFMVEGEEMVLRAIAGELADLVSPEYRQPIGLGILGHVIRTGRPYVAADVTRDPYYVQGYRTCVRTRSELCVPIKRGSHVVGALDIQSREPNTFTEADVETAEAIARWVSVAVENARLYSRLQQALEGAAATLAEVVEVRDPFTSRHQRRVAALATAISEEMRLPPDRIQAVRTAALLHDLGKIAVPAEVLNKPGKLSEPERALVREHPRAAYRILKEIPFPYPVAEIVFQHHERLDGSGYPKGLKGEKIMLEAKILAIADVVEAMLSHRPYRPPYPLEEVLGEIEKGKGSLYDPRAVEACLHLFREKGFNFPEPSSSQ
jgi:PAS domain S-box-containing protein/putative nucleotidyltransferase with HDIG domain